MVLRFVELAVKWIGTLALIVGGFETRTVVVRGNKAVVLVPREVVGYASVELVISLLFLAAIELAAAL